VDDDPLLRTSVRRLLLRRGFRVETAGDGREGLEKALAVRPDWIVSDVRMPVMDGPSMVRALREHALDGVQIVFLSGHSDIGPAEVAALGVEAMLAKPTSINALLAMLGPSAR
jgi:CheY-like chemotaxis protein